MADYICKTYGCPEYNIVHEGNVCEKCGKERERIKLKSIAANFDQRCLRKGEKVNDSDIERA